MKDFSQVRAEGAFSAPVRLTYYQYVKTYQDRHILFREQFNKMLGHEVFALRKGWTNEHASNLFIKHII